MSLLSIFKMNDVIYEDKYRNGKSLKKMKNKKRVLMSEKDCKMFVKPFSYVMGGFISLLEQF